MRPKRTYFGFPTYQQRRLFFETWEATGSVPEACEKARLGRRTFYYWKARFDKLGYAGLEEFESRVAHHKCVKPQSSPFWGEFVGKNQQTWIFERRYYAKNRHCYPYVLGQGNKHTAAAR